MIDISKFADPIMYMCRYQSFYLRDEEDLLVNGAAIKQSFVDQIVGTFYSLFPNNFVAVDITQFKVSFLTLIQ